MKKFFTVLVLVVVCMLFLPNEAQATTVASGTCGENLTWTLDDTGTLTISGTGAMEEWSATNAPWKAQTSIKSVVIQYGVTTIGSYAFDLCKELESVSIATTVKSIGQCAFLGSGLKKISIPDTVTQMGGGAFSNCNSLTEAYVGNGLKLIPTQAFYQCKALRSVTIGSGVTEIGTEAFAQCWSLNLLRLPKNLRIIGEKAFYICESLTDVQLPAGATEIKSYAFYYCSSLESVSFSKSLYTIGNSAFQYCQKLTEVTWCGSRQQWNEITIGANNTELTSAQRTYHQWKMVHGSLAACQICGLQSVGAGSCGTDMIWALDNTGTLTISGTGAMKDFGNSYSIPWKSHLTKVQDVIIESGVTGIGSWAFAGCTNLLSVLLPEGLTVVGGSAFSGCTKLTDIALPEGVERIEAGAFSGCTGLMHISIPDSVTYVTDSWWDCDNLVYNTYGNAKYLGNEVNPYVVLMEATSTDITYCTVSKGTRLIADSAFSGCNAMTQLQISYGKYSLIYIGSYAFAGCSALAVFDVPDTVKTIGERAFINCTGLQSLYMGEGVQTIGAYAFENCKSLQHVEIRDPEAWCNIRFPSYGYYAGDYFVENSCYYPNYMTGAKLHILDEDGAWSGKLTLGEGVTAIPRGAFINADDLVEVVIPEGVAYIGQDAFYGCDKLQKVSVPNSLERSYHPFNNCPQLIYNTYGAGKYLGNTQNPYVILTGVSNTSITEIQIHEDTRALSASFYNCNELQELIIPDKVVSIIGGFPESLTSVYIGAGVNYVSEGAFANSTNLEKIHISDMTAWLGIYFDYYVGAYGANPLDYGNMLYLNGKAVTELEIPEGVTQIGNGAFAGYSGLRSVVIPASVTEIADRAFDRCENLGKIHFKGDAPTQVGYRAFEGVTATVYYPEGNTTWDAAAFERIEDYYSQLTWVPYHYHTWTDATCTSPKTCSSCGSQQGKPLGHSYSVTTVSPTCTQPGTVDAVCTRCGHAEPTEHMPATGHSGQWVELVPVTCTEEGVKARICEVCGETEVEYIPFIGHVVYGKVVQATCTQQGTTTYYCHYCDYAEVIHVAPPTGHSYEETVTVAATCTQEGQLVKECTACGDTVTEVIPAKGHGWSSWVTTAKATCTKEGTKIRFCTCGVRETETIAKLPHSYADGLCATCGAAMSGYVVLSADMELTGLGLTEDLYIDLNGYDLSGKIITNGYKVYGMDSTTDGYTCEAVGSFSCVDENGAAIVPVVQFKTDVSGAVKRYMAIAGENGYNFHRFYLAITKVTVNPGTTGFGYKAVFYGDAQVLSQLDSFGFKLNLEGNTAVKTLSMEAAKLEMGRTYSLLLRNFDVENYGTADVNASVFLQLKDGTMIDSTTVSYSMRDMLQQLCRNLNALTSAQLQALRTMCLPFKSVMSSWDVDALLGDE